MTSQSIVHSYLDWAKERLDEIDATLSSFQHDAAKLQADVRVKAEKAMADMRAARDDFRRSVNEHANASDIDCRQLEEEVGGSMDSFRRWGSGLSRRNWPAGQGTGGCLSRAC